ncbi:hypothetical protein MSAN_02072600 [Mycena sanguinolenta]|uniref:DUF6699 domain-containing protein n=1 Tax=Mycena sanguinolenta TaxID=230812 RepID=A0A8H6XIA7_9AGAR|nr:hypothetical protein MSAN_02072600 [Mycena sanguinolenta]
MPVKEVHWKLSVEEYAARDSPESWTSPLPSPESCSTTLPTPTEHSSSAATARTTPPPPPQPTRNLPLPTTLEIHPMLTSTSPLQLDLSFPSDAFRRNRQLTRALLAEPACTPPRNALSVRIAAGLYKVRVQVRHRPTEESAVPLTPTDDSESDAVTVGDVLTTIQWELRQYDGGATPAEAQPYMHRRIATVNGYSERRSAEARTAAVAAESEGGGRIVDHLLGHTMFAGLTLQLGQPDYCWQLKLVIPERYAY